MNLGRGQSQPTTYYMIAFMLNVQNRKIQRYRKQLSGCLRSGEKEGLELISKVYSVTFGSDEHSLKLTVVMAVQLCDYTKTTELYT